MKTKIILVFTIVTAIAIGLVTSLADSKKINTKNINTDTNSIYLDSAKDEFKDLLVFDSTGVSYKHCTQCQAGVYLPDANNIIRCTFCNKKQ